MSATRVDDVVEALLERVVAGEFSGGPLPPEPVLAGQLAVSRLTVREAVKVLRAQGVLRVERGRGTFANPVSRWRSVALVARAGRDRGRTALQLVQVRRFIEVGATEMAARHVTPELIAGLEHHLAAMRAAHQAGDVAAFVDADLAFHDLILGAGGNPFVPVLYYPISDALIRGRTQTSAHGGVREHAIAQHARVRDALADGDPEAAARAMGDHLTQTAEDITTSVIGRHERD